MIKTGDYIVQYYNRYGGRLRDLSTTAESLMASEQMGKDRCVTPQDGWTIAENHSQPVSFTVDRRILNSLESEGCWK